MATKETQYLKNKRILITAGPTWVPIDSVRVISNIATGQTGILLAKEAAQKGAKVTLVLGPIPNAVSLRRPIKVIRFKFFDDLKKIIISELKSRRYDAVIHSAAVSDYRPIKKYTKKIKSDIVHLKIELKPTEKIIDLIKKLSRDTVLVGFKFEPKINKERLVNGGKKLIERSLCNLVVANTLQGGKYRAYIVNQNNIYGLIRDKNILARELINQTGAQLCKN